MDAHGTLHAMLAAGKKFSFDVSDLSSLPPRIVILSVKYVSKEALWEARYVNESEEGSGFVHWQLVNMLGSSKNALGGCAEWLGMLGFCQWDELHKAEAEIGSSHPLLVLLRRNLRECNLDTGGTDAWTLACKVFVLMLVQGLPSLHTLEVLTCTYFKKDTHRGCIELLAKQVCERARKALHRMRAADSVSGGRPSTSLHRRSTRPRWVSCWTAARWTRRGWSRRWRCRRRPWRTGS